MKMFWKLSKISFDQLLQFLVNVYSIICRNINWKWTVTLLFAQINQFKVSHNSDCYYDYYYIEKLSKVSNERFTKKG
jgi:hypothetical protein